MARVTLLWVDADDRVPLVILDAPADLPALLAEWNRLDAVYMEDEAAGEAAGWDYASSWLRARGVDVQDEVATLRLDSYLPSPLTSP